MKIREILTFQDFHEAVESFGKSIVVYRGQKSCEWELCPKVGRIKLKSTEQDKEEKTILRLFQEQSIPYVNVEIKNHWDLMAIAQHHGLPTRFLDWSRNPFVAAYFAVEEEFEGDSIIYAYKNNEYVSLKKYPDPFQVKEIKRFIPNHLTKRITAQAGLFTIHPDPSQDFKHSDRITHLIVRKEFRKKLKSILYKYGIHRASLFQDLDGLSMHIQWLRTKSH